MPNTFYAVWEVWRCEGTFLRALLDTEAAAIAEAEGLVAEDYICDRLYVATLTVPYHAHEERPDEVLWHRYHHVEQDGEDDWHEWWDEEAGDASNS